MYCITSSNVCQVNRLCMFELLTCSQIENAAPLSYTSFSIASASTSEMASISLSCSKVAKLGGISVFCKCSLYRFKSCSTQCNSVNASYQTQISFTTVQSRLLDTNIAKLTSRLSYRMCRIEALATLFSSSARLNSTIALHALPHEHVQAQQALSAATWCTLQGWMHP